ncbi:MAG: DUF4126 domain-containing protein [Candidatus Rokuibacteriota bacterium]
MDSLVGIPVGLALSAAAGFRVFVPLLLTGLAARFGYLTLTPGTSWLGSDAALVALATATVLEVGAYYVPWLDNVLDVVATPTAIMAGVLAWAAVTPELSPLLRWTLAVVAGGGAAGLVQTGTALLRFKSSTLTAGLGNSVVATAELAGSLVLSLLGLLAPLIAAAAVVVVLVVLARRLAGLRRGSRPPRSSAPAGEGRRPAGQLSDDSTLGRAVERSRPEAEQRWPRRKR